MKRIVFSLLVIMFQAAAFADTLTLEQARILALANSRSLAKYNMNIRNSILDERNHLLSMMPSPSASYSAGMNYLDGNWTLVNPFNTFNTGIQLSITQKIFEGGKSFINKAINAIATESVRKAALAEYFNVLDSADNAYYAVLESAATLEAEEYSLQNASASLDIAEIRQASGMINQGDYLRAMAEKESRENSRNQARRNLALSMTKFRAITGITENAELEPVDLAVYEQTIQYLSGISDEDADVICDRLWKILAQANPSLAMAELDRQRSEKNLSLAKRDYAPTVNATIYSGNIVGYSVPKGFESTSRGGIMLSGTIPIDFWKMTSSIEKRKNERDARLLDYINTEISLETDLQSSLLNLFAQAESVLSSRRSLDYTEKHFEYILERYRLSQSSVSDMGDASALLINSRNNYIKAQYGFLQSLSKLRSLGAIDDEERLIQLLMSGEG